MVARGPPSEQLAEVSEALCAVVGERENRAQNPTAEPRGSPNDENMEPNTTIEVCRQTASEGFEDDRGFSKKTWTSKLTSLAWVWREESQNERSVADSGRRV